MSLSVLVQCPHCHAQGNLADPALFGQAISCPGCQQTFVAPTPADQMPPAPTAVEPPPPALVAPAATGDLVTAAPASEVPPTPEMTGHSPPPAVPLEATGWPTQPIQTVGTVSAAAPFAAEAVANVAAATGVPVVVEQAVMEVVSPDQAVGIAPPAAGVVSSVVQQPVVVPAIPVGVGLPGADGVTSFAVPMPVPHGDASAVAPVAQPPMAGMSPAGIVAPAPGWENAGNVQPAPAAPSEIHFPVTGDFLVPERPAMEGPTPAFMAPPPPPGDAEVGFAHSLPEPVARGAVKPHTPPSKTLMRVVIGSITVIMLFATIMFLMGDPLRGKKPKLKPPVEDNPIAGKGAPRDESIENIFDRINNASKSNNK